MTLTDWHQQQKPLLLCNVWDAISAQIAQEQGFAAIGTSSAAIATNVGKDDGENITFEALLSAVKTIRQASNLPLSVDIEAGYVGSSSSNKNKIDTIVENITKRADIGVKGINIEDSVVSDEKRILCSASHFAHTLSGIRHALDHKDIPIFINVRTDTYLLGIKNTLDETLKRLAMYQDSGADGIFIPGIQTISDIEAVVSHTPLPVNVMCMPDLPDFSTLASLGVQRISMGNFVHKAMLGALHKLLDGIKYEQSFCSLFRD